MQEKMKNMISKKNLPTRNMRNFQVLSVFFIFLSLTPILMKKRGGAVFMIFFWKKNNLIFFKF